ncbi:hypothetical protein CsSME_00023813 [Camellia sinensis var. sinensis]
MAKHLKDLLSPDRISGFRCHFSIPDDVCLSFVADGTLDMERVDETTIVFPLLSIAEGGVRFPLHPLLRAVLCHWGLIPSQPNVNFFRIMMRIIALNRRLGLNLGIPAIRHCYALTKSSGRHGHYFLKAKDTDHQLSMMLWSSSKEIGNLANARITLIVFLDGGANQKRFEESLDLDRRRRPFGNQDYAQVFRPIESSEAGEGGPRSAPLRADLYDLFSGKKYPNSEEILGKSVARDQIRSDRK